MIPPDIRFEFLPPEHGVALRRVCISASRMAMPETAVNEDGKSVAGENDVGTTRQIATMEPKPVTHLMQDGSNDQFRRGVPRADP